MATNTLPPGDSQLSHALPFHMRFAGIAGSANMLAVNNVNLALQLRLKLHLEQPLYAGVFLYVFLNL